jgi:5-methylthioadenosine/S-adenosylhomocysteine deaminase
MIFRAKALVPVAGPPVYDGAVLVRGEQIADIGRADRLLTKYPDVTVTDFEDGILIPGLINLHSHIELDALSNIGEMPAFTDWLTAVAARNRVRLPSDNLESARRGIKRLLAAGMTATADISRSGSGAEAMTEIGFHGLCFHEIVAVDNAGLAGALEDLRRRMDRTPAGPGRRVGISPHSAYSLSAGCLKEIVVMAGRTNTPTCIHVAETSEEVDMLKNGVGPLRTFFDRFIETQIPAQGTGLSPVAYLDSLMALTRSTLAVHCVHIDDRDAAILRARETAVAVCPISNSTLGVGEAPIALLEQSGISYGAGTDSAASNPHMDLFLDLRTVRDIARRQSGGAIDLTADRLLRLATIEAAGILSMETDIGSLETGKLADLAVLRPPTGVEATALNIMDWATADDVVATILGGRLVYEKRIT